MGATVSCFNGLHRGATRGQLRSFAAVTSQKMVIIDSGNSCRYLRYYFDGKFVQYDLCQEALGLSKIYSHSRFIAQKHLRKVFYDNQVTCQFYSLANIVLNIVTVFEWTHPPQRLIWLLHQGWWSSLWNHKILNRFHHRHCIEDETSICEDYIVNPKFHHRYGARSRLSSANYETSYIGSLETVEQSAEIVT